MKSAKTTHTSVWIAQDTTESRMPRLNVHTNQILAHTFSHGTLDSVVSLAIHTLVCVVLVFLLHVLLSLNNVLNFINSNPTPVLNYLRVGDFRVLFSH